jgi:peptidoglycan/LPS O-acetylase OafA/YrhL
VAVLLVFAFHTDTPQMHGGFLGVDLFFVLSGYLITQLLFIEIEKTQKVGVGAFWGRRVKRLLPAFVVIAVSVIVWGAWHAPGYLRAKVQKDVIASVIYLANWRFISSSSYFSNDDTVSPLQHVWSLAIEEQFYVLWPGTVALSFFLARRMKLSVVRVVGVLSLVLAVVSAALLYVSYAPTHPERAYMGTDTRAFEPLVGALLAAIFTNPRVRAFAERARYVLFVLGLAGFLLGLFTLGTPTGIARAYFTGGAVGFVLACCLLIMAVESGPSLFAKVLSFGPVEKLGAISYGFYLWHWPLIVWGVGPGRGFNWKERALLLFGTIAISAVSYFLVETPVRHGRLSRPLTLRRLAWMTPLLLVALTGATMAAVKPPPKQGFTVLLVGDSVPKRLLPFVATEAESRHWFVYSAAVGGCATFPYLIVDKDGHPWNQSEECPRDVPKLQHDLVVNQQPDVVIWWSRYDLAERIEPDGRHIVPGTPEFWKAQEADLRSEIDRLSAGGARILFIEQDKPGKGMKARCGPDCHFFLLQLLNHHDWAERWNKMVRDTAKVDPRITVVNIDDVFCHDQNVPCDDSTPTADLYARPDGSHFSATSAPIVAKAILDHAGKLR